MTKPQCVVVRVTVSLDLTRTNVGGLVTLYYKSKMAADTISDF